jgi:hypothetical protein
MGRMRNKQFLSENLKGSGHLGDLDVDGRHINTGLKEMGCEGVAAVNTVI